MDLSNLHVIVIRCKRTLSRAKSLGDLIQNLDLAFKKSSLSKATLMPYWHYIEREDDDDEKPQRGGWLPGKQTACPRSPFPSLTRHHRTVNKRHSIQLTTSLSGSPVDVNADWGWENLLGCSQNLRSKNSAFTPKFVFVKNRTERSERRPCFLVGCSWHC